MKELTYITFVKAIKAYIIDDCDGRFHGKENEVDVLFNAERSIQKIKEIHEIAEYSLFELTQGK